MKTLALSMIAALSLIAACDSGGSTQNKVESGPSIPVPQENVEAPAAAQPQAQPKLTAAAAAAPTATPPARPELLDPAKATEKAPEKFKAKFETTKGDFTIEVTREWSPNGADRFYNLVKIGFFEDVAFFRAVEGFMVQFGIHGNPEVARQWMRANIPDDQVVQSNARGFVTFAKTGAPNSRSTQLFINYGNNNRLDEMGFSPIGQVVEGMGTLDALNKEYGEAPSGKQMMIQSQGNAFLRSEYPRLDYILKASLLP